ncbi:MAG TPA: SPFH domain-containing protein [Candidatus Xenobia bacterium]
MGGIRSVISTLLADGQEVMGPNIILWHYPNNDIMNGSLLTVESNHFCVLKSRGAILNIYETGQYTVETPQKILLGSIQQAFYGGASPWQYEAIYVNRAKLVVKTTGMALSREMAELSYTVDYYIHVETPQDASLLVQHMPYAGHALTVDDVNKYAGPVIEQSINQIIQLTPLEQINEKIHELTELVHQHLQEFLATYGIHLNMVKVLVMPRDERMRTLISLRALGLTDQEAVRHYIAMLLAERGVVSAPNMAIGAPFFIGGVMPTTSIGNYMGHTPGPEMAVSGPAGREAMKSHKANNLE